MPRFGPPRSPATSDGSSNSHRMSFATSTRSEQKVPAFLPFPSSATVDGTAAASLAYTISNSHHTPFWEGPSSSRFYFTADCVMVSIARGNFGDRGAARALDQRLFHPGGCHGAGPFVDRSCGSHFRRVAEARQHPHSPRPTSLYLRSAGKIKVKTDEPIRSQALQHAGSDSSPYAPRPWTRLNPLIRGIGFFASAVHNADGGLCNHKSYLI